MQDAPVTSISIEIENCSWIAADPKLIGRGQCCGPVEYLPNHEGGQALLDENLRRAMNHSTKHIYICDSSSMALRPLIPYAAGFIFSEGAALGHFSRALRHHRIPAIIDRYLWHQAREYVLTHGSGRPGHLKCGSAAVLSQKSLAHYKTQMDEYYRRLCSQHLAVPIYDAGIKKMRDASTAVDARVGEKALAVNALQANGFPTASALILTNLAGAARRIDQDSSFISVMERIFPRFGRDSGYELIVRGSLHSEEGSHPSISGLLTSPTVTSLHHLAGAVEEQVSRWEDFRDRGNRLGLAIVLQERISSPIRGVLGTGRPWDYTPDGSVVEFTLHHGKGASQTHVLLNDVETALQNGSLGEAARLLFKEDGTASKEGFFDVVAWLVRDGRSLRDRYAFPLDIEFVLTSDWRLVFVQFRPLFRLDPP